MIWLQKVILPPHRTSRSFALPSRKNNATHNDGKRKDNTYNFIPAHKNSSTVFNVATDNIKIPYGTSFAIHPCKSHF